MINKLFYFSKNCNIDYTYLWIIELQFHKIKSKTLFIDYEPKNLNYLQQKHVYVINICHAIEWHKFESKIGIESKIYWHESPDLYDNKEKSNMLSYFALFYNQSWQEFWSYTLCLENIEVCYR